MYSVLRKGFFIFTMTIGMFLFSRTVDAADTTFLPISSRWMIFGNENLFEKHLNTQENAKEGKNTDYQELAVADVNSFLYIRERPTRQSEWVGKLYPGDAARIMGPVGTWTKVRAGEVDGYVCSRYIIIRRGTEESIKDLKKEHHSKKGETARGQAVVDYACQFIGNPYVWGGTSLTKGADCSGFVQAVYKHFGVSLPRTSSEQRSAGHAVSYAQAKAGDIVCYDGHVGIYKGNGEIVNAINSSRGIGVLSATYTNIITVRRIF